MDEGKRGQGDEGTRGKIPSSPLPLFLSSNRVPAPVQQPIGLLAGGGRFPIVFAEKARSMGLPVVAVGIREAAPRELAGLVHRFHWSGPAQLGRMIRLFKRAGVSRIVMAGKIVKANILYKPWKFFTLLPDLRGICWWYFRRRPDNRDDTILLGVIEEFATEGLHFDSALTLCPELLLRPAVLPAPVPPPPEQTATPFAWD